MAKMDIEEYLNFFESIDVLELERRTNNHDESIVIPQDPKSKRWKSSIEIDDEEVEIDGVHESIRRYNIIFG